MKLTQLLTGMVVAAAAVYGGAKGYVHYKVKSDVDRLLEAARPFADVSYGSLSTDLGGRATLADIKIYPREFPDTFRIDALSIRGPNLDFLLHGFAGSASKGELPAQASLEIQGWHLSADSALLAALDQSSRELAEFLQIESDSCSLGRMFGGQDMAALGVSELSVDTRLGYRFTESFPGIELSLEFRAGAETGQLSMTLSGISRSVNAARKTPPRLRDLRFAYRLAPELTHKAVAYCAELRGVDRETFLAQLTEEPDELYMLQMGFVPGPGLRTAFQDLIRNPGEMLFEARPAEPVDLASLGLYNPAQLPDLLGITISVNGKPVEDLSLKLVDLRERLGAERAASIENARNAALGLETPDAVPEQEMPAETPMPSGYRTVTQAELVGHVGRPVRILASGGRKRNGRLIAVERGIATLEERRYGGKLTSSVALRDIVRAEVMF